MKPITVVGSYNTGLTMTVERIPRAGETLAGHGYREGPGGKGSNQAVAARRLGARVNFIGCVGADPQGDSAIELLAKEGVGVDFVKRSTSHTGLGFVIVDGAGSNVITIDPGANLDLSPEDVDAARRSISEAGVLLAQLEVRRDTVERAAKLAHSSGAKVIINPAPAIEAGEIDLSSMDILTPNEREFELLSGTSDIELGARKVLSLGPSAVVVTMGRRGARIVTAGESISVPAPGVSVVDTTGAGDAFNGALAVALLEGKSLEKSVEFACLAGAFCVTRREVIPGLPTRQELEDLSRAWNLGSNQSSP